MTQPPPRIRRDPRDPASLRARTPAVVPAAVAQLAGRILIDRPECFILAVVDLDAGRLSRDDRDLMGAARRLADDFKGAVVMTAFLPPEAQFRAKPDQEGADRVALVRDERFADELAETRVQGVLATAEHCAARHILFSETFIGGELARRVAARLGDRPAFNVRRMSGDDLVADIDAGLTEVRRPLPRVIVTARASFSPVDSAPLREALSLDVEVSAMMPRVHSLGPLSLDLAAVPLGEAELIMSAGSGLTDWEGFHQVAKALGAAEAGSRVVCDAGLLPRSRQVGASGLLVEPRCYMAFGIAGASQHLQGIAGAEHVIAVNTDLRADMVKRADLAIVADAQAILPALLRRVALRRDAGLVEQMSERIEVSHLPLRENADHAAGANRMLNRSVPASPSSGALRLRQPGEKKNAAPVLALVSVGRHPVSKRPRRAELDARALELALSCSPSVTAVHAGSRGADAPALQDYSGAGAAQLVVLNGDPEQDRVSALEAYIRLEAPSVIVTGARAEAGECSGMVPFCLAERLGYGIATNVVAIEVLGDTARVVQAMPGGRRRRLEATVPLIVTVDRTGPEPRLSARMRALSTVPVRHSSAAGDRDQRVQWSTKPSRPLPKRLSAPKAVGLGAGSEADGRREMIAPDPDVAADAILDLLERNGLLKLSQSWKAEANQ